MPIAAQSFGLPDGYFVPAEEVRHERTFMQWPASTRVHPDPDFLMDLQESIADIANTISAFEPVVMLMNRKHALLARRMLSNNVEIWDIPTDDLWARDSGPLFAVDGNGGLAVSNLNFNGWGNKQFHRNDGLVAQRVAERLGLPVYDSGITGEPGGVETDGAGTLMAHESSWVNPNRNDSDRAEIEARLLAAYGATKMIWAPGIAGADITDDHIDALARFVAPGQILIQLPDVSDTDPFSLSAFETYDILAEASDARGQRLQLVDLPYPERPRVTSADFVASYVNYYVCNGAVIAAEFGDRDTDQEAARVLADLYPDREIMMLNVDPVGETGGGIHCATQQQPATR
ncbi:agmatine deiminase family protein [Roseibium hamelinense]|nr:agmatine deiminase family protein [Roseibium hamelinense]